MGTKNNITNYSDRELSMLFLNEQGLYNDLIRAVKREDFSILQEVADEFFIYTPEQMEDLKETFQNEVEEYNNED